MLSVEDCMCKPLCRCVSTGACQVVQPVTGTVKRPPRLSATLNYLDDFAMCYQVGLGWLGIVYFFPTFFTAAKFLSWTKWYWNPCFQKLQHLVLILSPTQHVECDFFASLCGRCTLWCVNKKKKISFCVNFVWHKILSKPSLALKFVK